MHNVGTSLFNTLVMLILLVGGTGLIVRAVLPVEPRRRRSRDDDADRDAA